MKRRHFLAGCLIVAAASVLTTACKSNKEKRQETADPTAPAQTEERQGFPDRPQEPRHGWPRREEGERRTPPLGRPHGKPGERGERPQGTPPGGPNGPHFNDSLRPARPAIPEGEAAHFPPPPDSAFPPQGDKRPAPRP